MALVHGGSVVASWPLDTQSADLVVVDGLARLQLAARRLGCSIRLQDACPELRALVDLVGLADVLRVEVVGEAEGGEQLRIQEVVQPGDPPA